MPRARSRPVRQPVLPIRALPARRRSRHSPLSGRPIDRGRSRGFACPNARRPFHTASRRQPSPPRHRRDDRVRGIREPSRSRKNRESRPEMFHGPGFPRKARKDHHHPRMQVRRELIDPTGHPRLVDATQGGRRLLARGFLDHELPLLIIPLRKFGCRHHARPSSRCSDDGGRGEQFPHH